TRGAGPRAGHRGRMQGAQRQDARRRASIRSGPSRRGVGDPRRGKALRGRGQCRGAERRHSRRLLGRSQGRGLAPSRRAGACMSEPAPLISARGISKSFAGVEVLRDVDLDLVPGEIHALLGENGAGKSTFAKILAGVHPPTRGTIALNGRPVEVTSPIVAQKLGITLIHQEPISFPDLSVAENLVLGRHDGGWLKRVPWAEMTRDARALMDLLGVRIDVTRPMRGLSIADQQMVE